MDGLYPWIVVLHAGAVLLFFILHGASMAVAFRLKEERDPARVLALLDLSQRTLIPSTVLLLIGLLAGIVVGFMGDWWGEAWIWISLVLLLLAGFSMTPTAGKPMRELREALGRDPRNPGAVAGEPNVAAMTQRLETWNPAISGVLGIVVFLVILYLMIVKPF